MRRFLLHLNLTQAIAVLILIYLDDRNPMMGFLRSKTGYGFLILFCLVTLINCVLSIRPVKQKKGKFEK